MANFKIQATTPENKAELREATIIWVFKILKHNNTCCEQRTNRALNKSLVSMKKQETLMQQEILRKGFQVESSPALTSNSWCFLKQQLVPMYRQWYWDSLTRQWDDNCKTNCFERPGWKQTWCGIGLTWVLHARLSYIFLWMHFSTFLLNTFTPLASPHQSSITNHHSIITPPPSIILLVTWQFYPTTIAPLFGKYMKIWWYTSKLVGGFNPWQKLSQSESSS